jgi:Domain of unknown function (DUF4349)
MKNISITALGAALLAVVLLSNCSGEKKSEAMEFAESTADSTSIAPSSANVDGLETPEKRKFIRTADVRFKVKNVQNATNVVTEVVQKYGGFLTHSELSTQTIDINEVELSADSVLKNKSYEMSNDITLRIPNQFFDKTLRELQPLMTFLEKQSISADDVSLSLMASDLRKERYANFEKKYSKSIETKGRKLGETANAQETLFNYESEADVNKISTLGLRDQVNYSTITLHLYQPVSVVQEMLPNIGNIHAFKPNLFVRIWQSVKDGWYILEEIIVGITKLWFLFVLGFGGYWLFKLYQRRVKTI